MRLYTIGFTGKSAERFFDLLRINGVEMVVDIRLRPDGQLSGFAKRHDLAYFLRELVQCDYVHRPDLAPDDDILDGYRANKDWTRYVHRFEKLMDERGVPSSHDKSLFERRACCLLCSESTPERCHRTLVAERISRLWDTAEIVHLV